MWVNFKSILFLKEIKEFYFDRFYIIYTDILADITV